MNKQELYEIAMKQDKKEDAVRLGIKLGAQSAFADLMSFYTNVQNTQQLGNIDHEKVNAAFQILYQRWVNE